MSEKQANFEKLSEAVISELKALGYMESSLNNYRKLYGCIEIFMKENSVENYSPEI